VPLRPTQGLPNRGRLTAAQRKEMQSTLHDARAAEALARRRNASTSEEGAGDPRQEGLNAPG